METERRRKLQMDYNRENGITPKTIVKDIRDVIEISTRADMGYSLSMIFLTV